MVELSSNKFPLKSHTCLTCDNEINSITFGGDQCIICNPHGYISPGYMIQQDVKFSSEFIKDFGDTIMGQDTSNKYRYFVLNHMSNGATERGQAKIARLVIWLQEREKK